MKKAIENLEEITIRFAGDSGDGMQLAGNQFSNTSASSGIDVITFPDYPSEIRAPEGTLYGVSAFQIHLGSKKVTTPGDFIDVLVAMNASSLKVNLDNLKKDGIIIVNTAGFNAKNLRLAEYEKSPIESDELNNYQVISLDFDSEIKKSLTGISVPPKIMRKSKNIFALGMTYWLFSRSIKSTEEWLKTKFKNNEDVLSTNLTVLQAGWDYAQNDERLKVQYNFQTTKYKKGYYRNITGNHAVALGLVAASKRANLPLFLGSYPITPATDILQYISAYKKYGVKHLQAEDEIGGITSAIGASYGGSLAATTTSGPGLSLKIEALGLAVITELPLVIIDVMRGGPSTGLPTKPEQSDLFQAIYGRHGEAPLPVLAAESAADCFYMTIEAARIAIKYMTPVILLTDGYIAQGSEPWRIPDMDELPEIDVKFCDDPEKFAPYRRDPDTLARAWAIPGMQGMEHRIGGLEKEDITGNVSSDPKNHQVMTNLRKEKIDRVVNDIPDLEVSGPEEGELLMISWGSTYGAARTAFETLLQQGIEISHIQLKYLNPFPKNLGDILKRFKKILIPEMNMGQLQTIIQGNYLVPVIGLHKVEGQPFKSSEIVEKIMNILESKEVEK